MTTEQKDEIKRIISDYDTGNTVLKVLIKALLSARIKVLLMGTLLECEDLKDMQTYLVTLRILKNR